MALLTRYYFSKKWLGLLLQTGRHQPVSQSLFSFLEQLSSLHHFFTSHSLLNQLQLNFCAHHFITTAVAQTSWLFLKDNEWLLLPALLFSVSLISITFSTWTLNVRIPQGSSRTLFPFPTHILVNLIWPCVCISLCILWIFRSSFPSNMFLLIFSCMVDISTWFHGRGVKNTTALNDLLIPTLTQFQHFLFQGMRLTNINPLAQARNLGDIQALLNAAFLFSQSTF